VVGTVDASKLTTSLGTMTGGTLAYTQGSGWVVLANTGYTAVGTLYVWAYYDSGNGGILTSDFKVVYGASNVTNTSHVFGGNITALDARYNNIGYNAEVTVTSTTDVTLRWLFVGMESGSM